MMAEGSSTAMKAALVEETNRYNKGAFTAVGAVGRMIVKSQEQALTAVCESGPGRHEAACVEAVGALPSMWQQSEH